MEIDFITDELAVGSAPLTIEDFKALREKGIKAVVSLQRPEELKTFGLKQEALFHIATTQGIVIYNVPIRDFNRDDLQEKLDEAVSLLERLIDIGFKVYLHCAYGLQRSPTVAAAYLMKKNKLSAQEAVDIVVKKHKSQPLVDVLENWVYVE